MVFENRLNRGRRPGERSKRSVRPPVGVRLFVTATLAVASLLLGSWSPVWATPSPRWVTAWSAAPQGPSTVSGSGAETFSGYEYTLAAQQLVPPPAAFDDQTVRQVMYLHFGGGALRIQLSNEFGTQPVHFGAVSVGLRAGDRGADVAPSTTRPVTFGGARALTIPVGRNVLSDPVDLAVAPLQSVVLSIYVPGPSGPATVHGNAQQTFYTASGNQADSSTGFGFLPHGDTSTPFTATATTAYYWATGIQVAATPSPGHQPRTLVTLGDSITDGFYSSGDTNRRYPDALARRLLADPRTNNVSVVGEAISGSRVVRDGIGPKILDRLDSQVFSHPNVAGVIYLQGINDFGTAVGQLPAATADEVIRGYQQVAAAVHARGLPIFIGTMTPAGDLLKPAPYGFYSTPDANAKRNAVNQWLRTTGRTVFDGVIDFDQVVKDPLFPEHFALRYDSGDSLHPNDAGYQAMADSIPLEFLRRISGS
ncbi:lysophospholipase L1-like esterase [Streptomyces sp. V4I23]|nr:lysophospholipase L1-like esterase [Streptomyces sp. V4I23]